MRKPGLDALTLAGFGAIFVMSLPIVAGFFGAVHPAFDSMAHFRAHLAVVMAVIALPLLASSYRRESVTALALAIGAFATTVPIDGRANLAETTVGEPIYRLLQMNLRFDNTRTDLVLSLVERARPDVITLNEVSDAWAERLAPLGATYPYRIFCPFPNGVWGVAILSRRRFADDKPARCFDRGSFVVAPIDFEGRPVDVGALHLGWPWPFEQWRQIGELGPALETIADRAMLAGDFNASPWSAAVRRVAVAGDLSMIPSPGPTWIHRSAPEFLRFAGLSLDHVMAKGDIRVHGARTLEWIGSDHLPVLAEFSIPAEPPAAEGPLRSADANGPSPARGSEREASP